MKIKLLKEPYVFKGILRVEVETPYGKENIGLNKENHISSEGNFYLGEDGQPKWISEVKSLLEKKYESDEDKSLSKKEIKTGLIGKDL